MNGTPSTDTQSPWFEAYAALEDGRATRWLPGTAFPPAPSAPALEGAEPAADDLWTMAVLFECYNG